MLCGEDNERNEEGGEEGVDRKQEAKEGIGAKLADEVFRHGSGSVYKDKEDANDENNECKKEAVGAIMQYASVRGPCIGAVRGSFVAVLSLSASTARTEVTVTSKIKVLKTVTLRKT